jgi:DNA (cytosine-5)-methyltransferase 1
MVSHKQKLRSFHLFAGAGGGILADLLLEHEVIGACEIEKYPRDVLLARQQDGILPAFPIWDDVCTLDGNPWRGSVDILCGGFPCQDISAAGKGAGISGERSGLWKEYARLIGEMRPQFVFAENSPMLRTRGLGVVLEDLAALGYNARWGVLGAWHVGAPHKRDRMWVLAYASSKGLQGHTEHTSNNEARRPRSIQNGYVASTSPNENSPWWTSEENNEPTIPRVVDGVANRVHRIKAIGNGQVPQCAALAFSILAEGLI